MSWTTPITYVSGDVATAAGMNTYVKDDLLYIKSELDGTGSDWVTVPLRLVVANDANFYLDKLPNPNLVMDSGDAYAYDRAGNNHVFTIAGANAFVVNSNGKLTGTGFYSSGEFSIATGSGTTLSHGLSARPRVIAGFYTTSSGTENSKTSPIIISAGAPASVVYMGTTSSTQINVSNNTGVTIYGNVYAIL